MRATFPSMTVAEIEDMDYVDWFAYQQLAAQRNGTGV